MESNEPMYLEVKTIEHNLDRLKELCRMNREIEWAYNALSNVSKATDLDKVSECISNAKYMIANAICELTNEIENIPNPHEDFYKIRARIECIRELAVILADLEVDTH